MGNCCSSSNPPGAGYVYLEYNDQKRNVYPAPTSLEELRQAVIAEFPELQLSELSYKVRNAEVHTDHQLRHYLKGTKVHTIAVDFLIPEEAPMNLTGNPFTIQNEGVQHLGFVTNLNLVLTTSRVITSPASAAKANCDFQLDADVFYYRSRALSYTLVGLKKASQVEPLPIISKILRPADVVVINNVEVILVSVDPYSFSYKGDFMPGSPILFNGKVVGMHVAKNSGVNAQGLISELQTITIIDQYSRKINEFLAQIVFLDEVPSPTAPYKCIYSLRPKGLVSFNTSSKTFLTYELSLPKNPTVVQAAAGVYITGGFAHGHPTKAVQYFDTYTQTLSSRKEMITARHSHAAVCTDTSLYLISGSCEAGITNECEVFDFKKNMWKPIYPVTFARNNATAACVSEVVYLVGGLLADGSLCRDLETFSGDRWQTLSVQVPSPIEEVRAVSKNDQLFILGQSLWKFDGKNFAEETKSARGLPGVHAVAHNSKIYSFINHTTVLWTSGTAWEVIKNA